MTKPSRALALLQKFQREILEYKPEHDGGKFPTTPEEHILDKIDSILWGSRVGAMVTEAGAADAKASEDGGSDG